MPRVCPGVVGAIARTPCAASDTTATATRNLLKQLSGARHAVSAALLGAGAGAGWTLLWHSPDRANVLLVLLSACSPRDSLSFRSRDGALQCSRCATDMAGDLDVVRTLIEVLEEEASPSFLGGQEKLDVDASNYVRPPLPWCQQGRGALGGGPLPVHFQACLSAGHN